jgi:hypothetical protein
MFGAIGSDTPYTCVVCAAAVSNVTKPGNPLRVLPYPVFKTLYQCGMLKNVRVDGVAQGGQERSFSIRRGLERLPYRARELFRRTVFTNIVTGSGLNGNILIYF